MNQYKIAVCLSGQTRTFDYCKESILEFFPNCDFYCHTYDYNSYHEPEVEPIFDNWNDDVINDIKYTLNPVDFTLTTRKQSKKIFKSMGWNGDEKQINNYSMIYSIQQSFNYDFSNYDFVVKSRFDVIHRPHQTIMDYLPSEINDLGFYTDNYHDTDFAFNDAVFICGKDIANNVKKYKVKNIFPNNRTFLDFLKTTNVKTYKIGQCWHIVRPRFTKLEKDYQTLFMQYDDILKHDPSHLPGKAKEYFKRNPV